jgi:predicted lipoprotein with Yx(FWY)xxD motif
MHRLLITAAVAALVALGLTSAGQAAGGPTKVQTRHVSLGTVLVDGSGRTLYLFQKDKSSKSTCSGACADAWPPALTTGKPTAAGSARKSLLSTTKRSDGTTQVTSHGHPLYRFSGDSKPGQTKGNKVNAFGARWYAVTAAGKRVGGY